MKQWLKDAVFYEIYPQSFYDTNGDGIGDLKGIIEKLDYIKELGCNALWINPCFDSPFKDAGYDVRDYKLIAPRYGTMQYQDMTKKEMQREYHRLCQRYQEYEQQGLQLDLSRGKPAPEQLALSQRMLGELNSRSVLDSEDGTDCRNYGGLDGIPEAKALLAGMIGARPEQVMVGGNSSLTMMFDILSHATLDGLLGAEPWVQVKAVSYTHLTLPTIYSV